MQVAPDLQVRGAGLQGFVEAFGAFSLLAGRFLTDVGIGKLEASGAIEIDEEKWYPMSSFLRVYHRIERELGASIVYKIGLALPRKVPFPPDIRDVEGALRSIDVAYHLTHGRGGEPLFDATTGLMREGIGHYRILELSKQLIMKVRASDNTVTRANLVSTP